MALLTHRLCILALVVEPLLQAVVLAVMLFYDYIIHYQLRVSRVMWFTAYCIITHIKRKQG